jgi:hypothetical protein
MAYPKKYQQPSAETQEEAMKIAKATQRPGQTKEQTKLIAQGIQKGIDHYKKQQKSKARELNRKIKQTAMVQNRQALPNQQQNEVTFIYKQHWLPWSLLVISWAAASLFFLFRC